MICAVLSILIHQFTRPHARTQSWTFKGVMNATDAPTAPAAILVNGVAVWLVTNSGTMLDEVVYNATDCRSKTVKGTMHRVDCRRVAKAGGQQGLAGKLSIMYQRPRPMDGKVLNNATYAVSGSWSKRAINGTTAAAEVPLGVVVAVPNVAAFGGVYVIL